MHRLKHVVMVIPINTHVDKTQHIAHKYGKQRSKVSQLVSVGDFQLQTIMVMMMASTPSLKASKRFLSINYLSNWYLKIGLAVIAYSGLTYLTDESG